MAKDQLADPIYNDPQAAREWLELRLWPNGPICPHCGTVDEATLMKGKTTRPGLYQCNACREPFTVTVGTLYERSKIGLHIWLKATYLLMASKKGMSKNQLSRMLGVSQKSTWFLMHRIRESLRGGPLAPPMGSDGGAVEIDETFYGQADQPSGVGGIHAMNKVLSLVDRKSGEARSFVIYSLELAEVLPILRANIAKEARVMTDEAGMYRKLSAAFPLHASVNHRAEEWARGDVSTNTVEGYYSIMKRGLRGVYQHVSSAHLHRYVAEFDFRYTHRAKMGVDDAERFRRAIPGIVGKRLTYRRIGGKDAAQEAAH